MHQVLTSRSIGIYSEQGCQNNFVCPSETLSACRRELKKEKIKKASVVKLEHKSQQSCGFGCRPKRVSEVSSTRSQRNRFNHSSNKASIITDLRSNVAASPITSTSKGSSKQNKLSSNYSQQQLMLTDPDQHSDMTTSNHLRRKQDGKDATC